MKGFDFDNALISLDGRHKSEIRLKAIGEIDGKIFTLIFTMRNEFVRVISLRPASRKERKEYET